MLPTREFHEFQRETQFFVRKAFLLLPGAIGQSKIRGRGRNTMNCGLRGRRVRPTGVGGGSRTSHCFLLPKIIPVELIIVFMPFFKTVRSSKKRRNRRVNY